MSMQDNSATRRRTRAAATPLAAIGASFRPSRELLGPVALVLLYSELLLTHAHAFTFGSFHQGCLHTPQRRLPLQFGRSQSSMLQVRRSGAQMNLPLQSWEELSEALPSSTARSPRKHDSVLDPSEPILNGLPVLYRERHGWCPYSERVLLALEMKGVDYDTVLIDNTGGGRPRWFSGSTPQMRWENGVMQGESLDIIKRMDTEWPELFPLWPPEGCDASTVSSMVNSFKATFPRTARPSSRAAFLFDWDGDALPRAMFEKTLDETEMLLAKHPKGPFFCGNVASAADIAWTPFLERYAAQLPCMHAGLNPRGGRWPRLTEWYEAMDERVPAYACHVKGDALSWRKVLGMAGFGNAGVVPKLLDTSADDEGTQGGIFGTFGTFGTGDVDDEVWASFCSSRPHAAASPARECAALILRNREAIEADALKRKMLPGADAAQVDSVVRRLVGVLSRGGGDVSASSEAYAEAASHPETAVLAAALAERMCIPRDMGAPAAAALRRLAAELSAV